MMGTRSRRNGQPGRAWSKRDLPAYRARPLETLEACREAWEARNPEALRSGLRLCIHAGGLPAWLGEACLNLLKLRPVERRLWQPYRQDLIDFERFLAVRAGRRQGLTWRQATEAAAKESAPRPSCGSPAAMKKSYHLVCRRARRAPGRYALPGM
jgi:hypothetical protein